MNITQDTLIRQIAESGNMDVAIVQQMFRTAEKIIFDRLVSVTPTEDVSIKLFSGIQIRRNYVARKNYSKGMFRDIDCPAHVKTKICLSKYFSEKINRKLFENRHSGKAG
ncbi:MAG: hypothetical protein NC079_00590 [Clostridium sp.]|nr:hypothetical protein [Acetatifactor muris]MCM1527466.1 hypothetical protein [Bacteroides sp.]MCM1562088.1 hypothetical protein [Clostridium sp.]